MAEDRSGILEDVFGKNLPLPQKIEKVRGVYDTLGLSDRCRELEEKYAAEAVEWLQSVKMNEDLINFFTSLAVDSVKRIK